MPSQTDLPLANFDSAEICYEIISHIKSDDKNALKRFNDIVQEIVNSRDRHHPLDVKVKLILV